ncbi:MAG: hypothetical protein LBS28_03025 [Streptococcaceae bacterium]|jgi:hypothetical protein|nr:hypothetical protein [Streptococcaceae bacterium]
MEIRKEDFQYVEGDDSIKFLRIVKNKRKRKFSVYAFTTLFYRNLAGPKNAATFFVYYGLAGFCAVAIILGIFELTKDKLNWAGSLLPYLGIGLLAIISSFLISRLFIKIISFVLSLTLRIFKRNSQKRISNNNIEIFVDFIKIHRPDKTPFPEEL